MIDVEIDEFGRVRQVRRIQIPWALVVSILILALVAAGAAWWVIRLIQSGLNYEPTLQEQPAPGTPTTPLTQQVVLIIVDGLRYDTSRQMPFLEQLRGQGAHAKSIVLTPSVSQPAWTTILTGAGPELNGAALFNASFDDLQPIAVDHLFARARDMGLATGLTGHRDWSRMVPAALRDVSFFPQPGTDPAQADRQIAQAAIRFLDELSADFLVVHFDQVDSAGHAYGGASTAYYEAAMRVDALIRQIAQAMNLSTATLVVTADHGHLDQGGHGGDEPEVITTPFVVAGMGVMPGAHESIRQTDIAPTIAALLGTGLPALNEGQIRFEMLDMSAELRAEKAMTLARQHLTLASVYLMPVNDPSTHELLREEEENLKVAQAATSIGNFDSAYRLVTPTVERLEAAMRDARNASIEAERSARLSVALAAVLAPLLLIWWRRTIRLNWVVIGALLAFFFPLGTLRAWRPMLQPLFDPEPIVMRATLALALGVVMVLSWLWWHGDRRAGQFLATVLLAGLVVAAYFGLLTQPEGTYTVSAVRGIAPFASLGDVTFLRELAVRALTALGLGGLIVLLGLWWERERDLWAFARLTYGFVLFLLYLLLIPLTACYWRNGLWVTWYIPEADWSFLHLTTLVEMILVAGLGILLPLPVVMVAGLLRWLGDRVMTHLGAGR
jgi:hypothetical protein